jgi:hypothetical protein
MNTWRLGVGTLAICAVGVLPATAQAPATCGPPPPAAAPATGQLSLDLANLLASGRLRGVNRDVAKAADGGAAVHVSQHDGPGVVWLIGTDFNDGTVEVDTCGRDLPQLSFVGVAFHRIDDNTYESVYLRPFNFRSMDPVSKVHAVQYMFVPDYDWPRLRQEFSNQFESGVDASLSPTAWVHLRVVVTTDTITVFAGPGTMPALTARRLGHGTAGLIGLWVGNNSDGNFANLKIGR